MRANPPAAWTSPPEPVRVLQRQANEEPAATPASAAAPAAAPPAAPGPPAPTAQDPDLLYEDIVRRLRRDLLIERERHGDLLGGMP
jgi:hypothetical protein